MRTNKLANKVCGWSSVFFSQFMGSATESSSYSKPFKCHPADYLPAMLSSWLGRKGGSLLAGWQLVVNRLSVLVMTCRPCLKVLTHLLRWHFEQLLLIRAHVSPVREEEEEEEEMITEPAATDPPRASEQKWEFTIVSYFCWVWLFIFIHFYVVLLP